jgi:hypothetical protein
MLLKNYAAQKQIVVFLTHQSLEGTDYALNRTLKSTIQKE